MKDRPVKPAVLRDVAQPAQPRALALPRHRRAVDTKAAEVKASPVLPSSSAGRPSTPTPVPSIDEVRAARERAHAEGLQAGLKDAQARIEEAVRQHVQQLQARADAQAEERRQAHAAWMERLSQTLAALDAGVARRLEAIEADAVALAFTAVCRIIGDTVVSRDGVAALVRHAIAQVSDTPVLRVRLHPDDFAAIAETSLPAAHPTVNWQVDPSLTRGACLVDSAQGTLDTRLDRQLERLRDLWVRVAATDSTLR
jgi:flagellar assembly protein FliH